MAVSRPWQDESDYARLRRFLQNLPGMAEEAGILTIGDLDWWRYTHSTPDKMREAQLWLDDDGDTAIGFVWPEGSTFDCFIDPRLSDHLPDMIAWGEASALSQGAKQVAVMANDRDEQQRSLLEQAGYAPDEFHYVFRGQSITRPLEPPALPEGFWFRDMRAAANDEVERRVDLHRAVWAPSTMTVAKHRAV
jgi:hypothetical protein